MMGLHFLTWLGERKRQDRNEGANRNFLVLSTDPVLAVVVVVWKSQMRRKDSATMILCMLFPGVDLLVTMDEPKRGGLGYTYCGLPTASTGNL
jgi:hypothetical protein